MEPNIDLIKALEAVPSDVADEITIVNESAVNSKKGAVAGMCVECEDTPRSVFCEQCQDEFCDLCFSAQHRKGKRAQHNVVKLNKSQKATNTTARSPSSPSAANPSKVPRLAEDEENKELDKVIKEVEDAMEEDLEDGEEEEGSNKSLKKVQPGQVAEWFLDRAKWIPVRLTLKERKQLRLLEAALFVSEYTDKIDIISWKNKGQRIHAELQEICAILSGLAVAADYKIGQQMIVNKNFKDNAEFFQRIFEIGRRHKIMNPEKMRTEYGKLIYLLQDSVSSEIEQLMGFNMVIPVKTVFGVLEEADSLDVLKDPLMMTATAEIVDDGRKARQQIQREIKMKEAAIESISRKYAKSNLSSDEIKMLLYSIGDNNSFLTFNRDPVEKMIQYLTSYFKPNDYEPGFSLSIQSGVGGARLSHSHERQYYYALQSLSLWRDVSHHMFKLWCLAESDLLDSDTPYRLRDTGQGLNRVQDAPHIGRAISKILHHTQQTIGGWVGSSVIHLGDHNVPNALMFIDKYTQVSRILNPIVITCNQVPKIAERDPALRKYIEDSFGSAETCIKEILCDFFKYAFDGSGADNFFDAGSCIDGRLTSAWNWCSKIEKKKFYPVFKLTGFIGFDGDFQK